VCSSLDRTRLAVLLADSRWTDESLFSMLEGLVRLGEIAPGSVGLDLLQRRPASG
jgi:hypothetical protein